MTRRVSVGVSMQPEEVDEIDERRGGESRSEYIREAVKARKDAEDRGEWDSPDTDETLDTAQAHN